MYKIRIILASFALFAAQQVFADDAASTTAPSMAPTQTAAPADANAQDMSADGDSKPCLQIAKACKAAGFTRRGAPGKRFWKDCMKPVVLGQPVAGLTVSPDTVKACRVSLIEKAKSRLQELQSVSQ